MRRRGNYKLLDKFSWYVPGIGGILVLMALLMVGALAGAIVNWIAIAAFGTEVALSYGQVISYPVMFIPPMIYASIKSASCSAENTGYRLDSENFTPLGAAVCALLACAGTLAIGFCCDGINALLPEMPEYLKEAMQSLTGGNFLLNFICVGIFAPFFEEWLCRGMVLRGLLKGTRMHPAAAIPLSALVFAIIHFNLWQAVPAFIMGCLFGYVYYRTGSLKITMLMHAVNNTFSLICGHIDALEDMDSWMDAMPYGTYALISAACFLLICLVILAFRKIPVNTPGGNIDETAPIFESYEV